MELLQKILSTNSDLIMVVLLVLFFSMESILNRPVRIGSKLMHLLNNFLFQLTNIGIGFFVGIGLIEAFDVIRHNELGLLQAFPVRYWFRLLAGLILLDFFDYWMHRLSHRVPILWLQHRVHHSDTVMDTSTAFRSFPTESIYFVTGYVIISAIFGLDVLSLYLFFFLALPANMIQHANFKYPQWVRDTLGKVFALPDYHKIHHEQDQNYTDSNYGTIFILWDRMFGTFRFKPIEEINYGLPEFEAKGRQSFFFLIRSPFLKLKEKVEEE